MGRKILFKAKRMDNGEWVKGDLLHKDGKTYIYGSYIDESGVYIEDMQVDPSTVCQFTGLKDKDGKEVWEHDIVLVHKDTEPAEVIFEECHFEAVTLSGNCITQLGCVAHYNFGIVVIDNKFDRMGGEK